MDQQLAQISGKPLRPGEHEWETDSGLLVELFESEDIEDRTALHTVYVKVRRGGFRLGEVKAVESSAEALFILVEYPRGRR